MEYVLSLVKSPSSNARKFFSPAVFLLRHIHDHFIPHARNNYHPHVLGHRALGLFSALLVTVKIFTLSLVAFGPVLPAYSSAITGDNIISLTNESRKEFSLPALRENRQLSNAAQAKANDMLAKGYFSHNTPDGKTPWNFIQDVGYNYLMAGENLAVNFTESEAVEQAWMNSPGHKANILNKNFEEIGIGISQGEYQGHTAIFVVQMFGTPVEQKVAISEKPTQVLAQQVPAPATIQPAQQADRKPAVAGSKEALVKQPATEEMIIQEPGVVLEGDMVKITAKVLPEATKVIAYFGERAAMLTPKPGNMWVGSIPLQTLAQGNTSVRIKAFNMQGESKQTQLADFTNNTAANYNVLGAAADKGSLKVKWFGKVFDPHMFEQKFYLLFIAGLLSSLILAIGIRRHIQHLSLVTNSSFVVVLAVMLWMAG